MCLKKLNKRAKNFSYCDIGWIKLSSMAFILVVVKGINIIWNWNLLEKVSIWWFVIIFVLAVIKPLVSFCKKVDGGIKPTEGVTHPQA